MQSLLLLEDDLLLQDIYLNILSPHYRVLPATRFTEAVLLCQKTRVDGALVDIHLKEDAQTGYDFLLWFKKHHPEKPALIQSGTKEIPLVVRCMQAGAEDYIEKPIDPEPLLLKLDRLFKRSAEKNIYDRGFRKTYSQNAVVGDSKVIENLKDKMQRAKGLRILFTGETGVGKTPFAYYSHEVVADLEGRPRPFEQVNCAGLNGDNFDDILFGHKKGAFTGAISDKKGLIELARGGDLFLDEISELSLESQSKFLTFLDSQNYYRLGDDRRRTCEVRIMAATNFSLREKVKKGEFRQDLFSRLAQVEIHIPPLRERMEDVPPLFRFFIQKFLGYEKPYDQKVLNRLMDFSWAEGNVRELRDAVEYLCLVSKGEEKILMEHLPDRYQKWVESDVCVAEPYVLMPERMGNLEQYMGSIEKKILESYLAKGLDETLKDLEISRATLYRKLKKYDLKIQSNEVGQVV